MAAINAVLDKTSVITNEQIRCTVNNLTSGCAVRVIWTLDLDNSTTVNFSYPTDHTTFGIPISWHTAMTAETKTASALVDVTKDGQTLYTRQLNFTVRRRNHATLGSATVNVGSAISVNIKNSLAGDSHSIEWYINSTYKTTHTAAYSASGTTDSFTIPQSWLAGIPGTSITAHCKVTSTNSGTLPTTATTLDFTVQVPASVGPTVASGWYSVAPLNTGLPVSWTATYVKGHSKIKATFDTSKVTAAAGSTIASYKLIALGAEYGSSASYTSATITTTGTITATVRVTDSRGRYVQVNVQITVYDWSAPVLTIAYIKRCLQDGTESSSGTYIKAKVTASVSQIGASNTFTLKARTKVGSGDFGSLQSMTSGTEKIFSGFDPTQRAVLEFTCEDQIGSTTTSRTLAAASAPAQGPSLLGLHIREGGTAAAFGKNADANGWLQTNFTSGFQIVQGLLRMGSSPYYDFSAEALHRTNTLGRGMQKVTDWAASLADLHKGGIYYYDADMDLPDKPGSHTTGIVVVFWSGWYYMQIVFTGFNDTPRFFFRMKAGYTTDNWRAWREVTTTAVT